MPVYSLRLPDNKIVRYNGYVLCDDPHYPQFQSFSVQGIYDIIYDKHIQFSRGTLLRQHLTPVYYNVLRRGWEFALDIAVNLPLRPYIISNRVISKLYGIDLPFDNYIRAESLVDLLLQENQSVSFGENHFWNIVVRYFRHFNKYIIITTT